MKQLPKINWDKATKKENPRLSLWLRMREADLALREGDNLEYDSQPLIESSLPGDSIQQSNILPFQDEESTSQALSESAHKLIAEFDALVKEGDIRLLSSSLTPTTHRPVYVAVLRKLNDAAFLVAPFSPYQLPAMRTELWFPDRSESLQTLCLWNVTTVSISQLQKSWFADHMSEKELSEARLIYRHATTGQELPQSFESRVGDSISSSEDPRLAYQHEETMILEQIAAQTDEVVFFDDPTTMDHPEYSEVIELSSFEYEPMLLAAQTSPEAPPQRREYCIAGIRSLLCFYLESNTKEVVLAVYERNGDQSRKLDSTTVCGPSGEHLATVQDGFARFPARTAGNSIVLQLPSGQRLKLFKKQDSSGE